MPGCTMCCCHLEIGAQACPHINYIHHTFILSIMHTILTSIQNYLKSSFREKESAEQNFDNINVTLAPIKKDGQEEGDDITISLLRIEEETSRKPQKVYHYNKDEDKLIKKLLLSAKIQNRGDHLSSMH